nr:hypothetical protein [uncultured Cohaesibacter sp.]
MGVTKQEAKAFLAQFKDVNDKLRQECLPDMEEPIFDDDFSDYPDTLESSQPKYEEAVALAVKLWKQAREL